MITPLVYDTQLPLEVFYLGPSLNEGPKPALIYLAISAQESLILDPFNQPIKHLEKELKDGSLRIFSITLPGHEEGLLKEKAIEYWAQHLEQGIDLLTPFIYEMHKLIEELENRSIILKNKLVLAGLSRGGFLSTLLAAFSPLVNHILGFAPLTDLSYSKAFENLPSIPSSLNLFHQTDQLLGKKLRFYIGNRDSLVKTDSAFRLISNLAEKAYETRTKGGSFELLITNSIGYMGHGTSPETFLDGAKWIKKELGISS